MNSNKIPIAMASDTKLFFTIGPLIVSILDNAQEKTFYDIYILCAGDVTQEQKDKLSELKSQYQNFSLSFIDMKDTFKNIPKTHTYVNYVASYKFLIPSLLKQLDRIIYLDVDTIVRKDLSELYNTDMGDNYIGGCVDLPQQIVRTINKTKKLINLESMDYYINSGVLLMNLQEIRKNKIDEQCISMIGSFKGSVDQHIFNKVCYGKIYFLPLKYNVSKLCRDYNLTNIFYCLKEAKETFEDPAIFHWFGKEKPWNYYNLILSHEWFRYFIKSPFKDIKLNRQNNRFEKVFTPIEKEYFGIFKRILYPNGRNEIFIGNFKILTYRKRRD